MPVRLDWISWRVLFPKMNYFSWFPMQEDPVPRYNNLTLKGFTHRTFRLYCLLVPALHRKNYWPHEEGTVCPPAQIRRENIFAARKIRCVLVHNHVLVRQGLRRLLEDEPDLEIVAEAGNAAEALQRVFEQRPDVVLADAATVALSADDAERLILRESPDSRVFFLGLSEENDHALLSDGTGGETSYVAPHTSAEELVARVMGRAYPFNPRVREMPGKNDGEWIPADSPSAKKRGLTAREHEVLKLLAEGRTVRSAAGVLGLSAKTVDAHKFNLMRKLGIHNKAELVMWAIHQKVVKLPVNY